MDIFHLVGFVVCIGAEVALRVTGHSDPTTTQAMLGLASMLGGSQIRAMTSGGAK